MQSSNPPPALDYATPPPARRQWGPFVWHLFNGLTLLAPPVVAMILIVPHFERFFRDFKVELPAPTMLLLKTSRWLSNDFGWVYLLPLPVLLAMLLAWPRIVAATSPGPGARRPSSYRVYRLLTLLLLGGFTVFFFLALFRPYVALLEGISSAHK